MLKNFKLSCFIFSLLAFTASIPIMLIEKDYIFAVFLWMILFLGGGTIPIIQGIMISSLKPELRASANSISNTLSNLLGFLPAPFIYGVIYDNTKDTQPKLAMSMVLSYSGIGVILIGIAMFFRYKNWEEIVRRNIKTTNKDKSEEKDSLLSKSLQEKKYSDEQIKTF